MADYDPIDQQNLALEALFADALRDLPDETFRLTLKEELMQSVTKQATYLPPGFHAVTPYLINSGAARLIDFLKEAFGAEETMRIPVGDGIMHAQVRVGDSVIEIADGNEKFPPMPTSFHIYVTDADAVYRRALEAGGTSLFEPADREYGDREAGVKDTSGNQWFIGTHKLRPGEYRPEGLYEVTNYLHPKGADDLVRFLEEAFGAERVAVFTNKNGAIEHAKIRIGDSFVEMGEAHGEWQPTPASIHLYVPDADAVYARALAAGAASIYDVVDQPYGERSGGVQDRWGNKWWIATHTGKMQS